MTDAGRPPVGWARWGILLFAVAVGSCSSAFIEYIKTGAVQLATLGTAAAMFVTGLSAIGLVVWFGAQDARTDSDGSGSQGKS